MRKGAIVLTLLALGLTAASQAGSATRLPGFRSPSRNISCLFIPRGPAHLLCKIARADYSARLEAHCGAPPIQVDWAGFELVAGRKGTVVCSGGILYDPATQHPSYVTLPYGKTWRRGAFTCRSRVTGVTCRNRQGHGLFVSRQAWRAW